MTNYIMIYSYVSEEVLNSKSLSALDKLLFERITALCHKEGYCYATNEYLANIYGVKKNTVSFSINKLIKQNLLKSTYEKYNNNKTKRYLYLMDDVWSKNDMGISYLKEDSITDNHEHNSKYNNKRNNKIINYDTDGVMIWNGTRCESVQATLEEQEEMENLIKSCIGESDD